MHNIVLLTLLLWCQTSRTDDTTLNRLIAKMIQNYDFQTLVVISDSTEEIIHLTDIPSVIFTTNDTNIILADRFSKSLLMLVYYNNDHAALQKASYLMLDNFRGGGKVLIISDHINIPFNMLKFGNLAVGLFCRTSNEFYAVDFSESPKFPLLLIPSSSGVFKTSGIQKTKIMNIRVSDKWQWHGSGNCTWEWCQFILLFCEKFNLKLNVSIEPTLEPVTLDFRLDRPEDLNFKETNFFEYNALNVVVPRLKVPADRNLYFLVPFSKSVWLLLGIVVLLLVALISLESNLRYGELRIANNLFLVFQMIFAKVNQNLLPPTFKRLQGLLIVFVAFMITEYCCSMGSYLQKTQDASQFEILCFPKYAGLLSLNNKGIETKVKIVPKMSDYIQIILTMDTKYGYCIDSSFWSKFQHIQRRFNSPLFRLISKWKNNRNTVAFVMRRDSEFRGVFDNFILQSYFLGLMKKWNKEGIDPFVKVKNLVQEECKGSAFSFSDVKLAFEILLGGLILAWICFIMEWYYFEIRFARGLSRRE